MNYIEIELGGKLRKIRFGLGMLGDLLDHLKLDIAGLGELIQKNPFKAIPNIIYFGAKYELEKVGQSLDFTVFDVNEWIEELEGGYADEKVDAITLVFVRSLVKHVPTLKAHIDTLPDEQKKRLIG